jgi:hypothetical protein
MKFVESLRETGTDGHDILEAITKCIKLWLKAGCMASEVSETTNFQPAQLAKALEIVKKMQSQLDYYKSGTSSAPDAAGRGRFKNPFSGQ